MPDPIMNGSKYLEEPCARCGEKKLIERAELIECESCKHLVALLPMPKFTPRTGAAKKNT